MSTSPIKSSSVSKNVADHLRAEIRSARLKPGTRLRQEDIAVRLGVSTTPVREAFRILQTEGLVTLDPHRGVEVFRPSMEDVLEYYEIRQALELLAISKAIPNMAEPDIAVLEDLLEAMDGVEDGERWVELNNQFHTSVYHHCGRPRLCAMISNLSHVTAGYVQMAVQRARENGQADREHRQILEACKRRDVPAAQRAIKAHLQHTVDEMVRFLEAVADVADEATAIGS